MTLHKTIMILSLTFSTAGAMANNLCLNDAFKVQKVAGYALSSSEISILGADRATAYAKKASKATIVNRILVQIQEKANRGHSAKNSISDESLANEIYLASRAWGLDPFIFTKMIEQESQFYTAAFNPSAYDSGLAQTTYWAFKEMKAQYEKPVVGDVLFNLSDKYFNALSPRAWVNWITKSRSNSQFNREMSVELRQNVAYSLASGASLLKIYLAEANGDYRTALKMYNGAWSYADEVLKRKVTLRCGEAAAKADQIIFDAAGMVEGTSTEEDALEYLKEFDTPKGVEI